MKHIFIINPAAGKKNITQKLTEKIAKIFKKEEYEIYVTKAQLDAKRFVNEYCLSHQDEHLRFYSCGGDGTLNEVINGAYGFSNVSIGCFPSGSGNDFIKYFAPKDDFLDIEKLINGKEVDIDLLQINDRFVVNIFNIGFDANVAERMIRYKKLPFISGKGAYILGVIVSFFHKLTTKMQVFVDDNLLYDGDAVLSAVANAICYGGGFYCAPKAKVDDGLLDVVLVKKVSHLKFLRFIKHFKNGTHLEEPKLKDTIIYKQGKVVRIITPKIVSYAIDGEMCKTSDITIRVVPKAIKFITV